MVVPPETLCRPVLVHMVMRKAQGQLYLTKYC
jgi:hypothetical protein